MTKGNRVTSSPPTQEEQNERQKILDRKKAYFENMSPTMIDFRNHELRIRAIEQQLGITSPPLRSFRRRLIQQGDDDFS